MAMVATILPIVMTPVPVEPAAMRECVMSGQQRNSERYVKRESSLEHKDI